MESGWPVIYEIDGVLIYSLKKNTINLLLYYYYFKWKNLRNICLIYVKIFIFFIFFIYLIIFFVYVVHSTSFACKV